MHLLSSKGECVALHKIRLTVNKFNITNYMHYELESFTILKEQLTYITSDSLRNKGKKKDRKLSFINIWKMLKHYKFYNKFNKNFLNNSIMRMQTQSYIQNIGSDYWIHYCRRPQKLKHIGKKRLVSGPNTTQAAPNRRQRKLKLYKFFRLFHESR